MRRTLIAILLVLAVLILLVMGLLYVLLQPSTIPEVPLTQQFATDPPPGTPSHLVREYVSAWSRKDTASMDALCLSSGKVLHNDMPLEARVELIEMTEAPREEAHAGYIQDWYPNPADIALVYADYVVYYNQDGQTIYLTESYERQQYTFWLIKETADSSWRIVKQGI